jgi:N-acetylmuramoyl-L-alanine amidase
MSEIIEAPSPNFDERSLPITMLVLHYTGMEEAASAIARLRAPEAKVSAHYVVAEDGQVLRLVDEQKRAWHAGRSFWRGVTDVNSASVGIEIINPGHEFGYRPFPDQQMDSLVPLVADIVRRHKIIPPNVVGHSDIAPERKQDPGELFDWAKLARLGLAMPRPTERLIDPLWTDGGFLLALERYGYDVRKPRDAVIAFQRRFRPELLDGVIDGETRAILLALLLDRRSAPST